MDKGETKMCRLCGQYERIYIDVFGEEGIKRFLGRKIHTKINILIDEKDPLPKAICVQCLGKLEFVCDFQEECLRTQQVLRDRYNPQPVTESVEVKEEDSTSSAGTSSSENKNSIEKVLESSNSNQEESQGVVGVVVVSIEQQKKRPSTSKTTVSRNLRSQQQQQAQSSKYSNGTASAEKSARNHSTENTETSPTRWLRSRQNTDSSLITDNEKTRSRLRSHDIVENTRSVISNDEEIDTDADTQSSHDSATIQLPTSALNKLLTIVSGSPDIEVSVKETKNRSSDAEDISFTVELCKKQNDDDVITVRARVFPDQGYCLVDTMIMDLLRSEDSSEVNDIVNNILSGSSAKNGNGAAAAKLKDLAELEQRLEATHPEDLFKIDGEEIKVDDNVEQVTNDEQTGYECKLCRKFYERRDKCTVHVKTHLGIKQYTCVVCNAKFVCKSDVMKHIRCSHTNPRPIQCPKCPKRFKSKFYLAEHDNVHKGVRPYSCTDCGQSYHHKVSLQIHMKSHLPPQNLACEYCGKVFPFRTRLLGHIASVHMKKRRNFRCRFCYNLYSSLAVLNEHVKTRHATTYTCDTCGKTFKVSSKYKAHVMQHSNPKPFVCHICNNRYASKAFLNEHLLKHEGLRKHICQECGASFAQASHLAAHRHVHGEKRHACPECGKKFNRRDNMKVHRKRHFEEKTGKRKSVAETNGNGSVALNSSANEKISKDDGLPQQICIYCVGKLNYIEDFCKICYDTQIELAANRERREEKENENAETNKENATPDKCEKKSTSSTDQNKNYDCNSVTKLNAISQLPNKPQRKNYTRNYLCEIIQIPKPTDVKQEINIKEERSNEETTPLSHLDNSMVWIPSLTLPTLCKLDISKDAVQDTVNNTSLLDEKVDETQKLDSNLINTMNQENAITNLSLQSDKQNRKPRITELLTQEQWQTIERYYKKDMSVVDKQKVQSHMTVNDKKYECNICSSKYSRCDKCEVHIWGHLNMKPYQCTACNFTTVTLSNVRCHIRKTHLKLKLYSCTQCVKQYASYVLLQEHMNVHTGARPFKCKECNFASSSRQALLNHKDVHNLTEKFSCPVCNKIFSSRVRLRAHKRIHNNRIICELCRVPLSSEKALEEHRSKVHSQNYICNVCFKVLNSRKALHNHMNTHAEAKYKCEICSNVYKSKHILSEHILKHDGIRKYNCSICDKKFAQMSHLAAHKKVHSLPSYTCEGCKRKFNRRDNLKTHMKRCVSAV